MVAEGHYNAESAHYCIVDRHEGVKMDCCTAEIALPRTSGCRAASDTGHHHEMVEDLIAFVDPLVSDKFAGFLRDCDTEAVLTRCSAG